MSQFQTECCYDEGSTGVLEIVDADGGRVGEIVEAGPLTQVPNGEGDIGFVSEFPETSLAPGRYTVAVWQLDWPFTIADVDRASQLDLCTVDVEIAPSEVLELVATWAPGVGCLSFEPPTNGDTPAVRVACGGALLSRVSSAHAARNELLGDQGETDLAELRKIDPGFVDGFGWSTVTVGSTDLVLLGSVVEPVGDGPFLAYAVFESGRPVDWGSCDLEVEATGFALVPFFAVGASTDDPAGTTVTVRVCEAAANDGRRIAPAVVETPDIVVLAMLVERPPEGCATTDRFVDVEVGLGFPWEQRPIIDASVDGGAVRIVGDTAAVATETQTVTAAAFGITFDIPAGWERGRDQWVGDDGFVQVSARGAVGTIDELAELVVGHQLDPYGTEPTIEELIMDRQVGRLVMPSADGTTLFGSAYGEILATPANTLVVRGETYTYLTIVADIDHIREIAASIRWLP